MAEDSVMHGLSERRLSIALIAPNCDGTDVGEAWSSFQWARGLSERCELTVLTYHKRNRPSTTEQIPNAEVVEWLDLPIVGRFERFNNMAKPGYIWFYLKCRRWLRNALAAGRRFDLIHQVAPLSLRYPSPAAGLGMPLIIGPLAGSLSTPAAFRCEESASPWYTYLRGIDRFRIQYDPVLRNSYESANVVIGVAPYVGQILDVIRIRRFEVMSETGVTELPEEAEIRPSNEACRLLYVGRVTRTKGVRDAIRAVHVVSQSRIVTLDIVGDGEDRQNCEEEVSRLGLGDFVTFHGRLPRPEVNDFYRRADVFLFPSVREPSGNVVLEAMSFGLPLIVADRGGPGYVVDSSHGICVPVTSPSEYAERLATAIVTLANDPDLRTNMGKASRSRVEELHLWDRKIDHMCRIYGETAVS